jgi:hypothetical protein
MSVIPSIAPRTGGPATGLLAAIRPLRREGIETTVIATDMGRAASASSAERISLTELASVNFHLGLLGAGCLNSSSLQRGPDDKGSQELQLAASSAPCSVTSTFMRHLRPSRCHSQRQAWGT